MCQQVEVGVWACAEALEARWGPTFFLFQLQHILLATSNNPHESLEGMTRRANSLEQFDIAYYMLLWVC